MTENNYIAINTLQHYIFCPHQWGLMEIEQQWCENIFVVLGNLVHEKVDKPFLTENRNGLHISRSLPVYSHKYKIQGVCDVVEFIKNKKGAYIKQLEDNYIIKVVEYKRGKPKEFNQVNYADSIQLTAQMLCINEMFNTNCEGFVYYASIGRRCKLNNFNELTNVVFNIVEEMTEFLQNNTVPPITNTSRCNGCSFKEICIPNAKTKLPFNSLIKNSWEEQFEKTT